MSADESRLELLDRLFRDLFDSEVVRVALAGNPITCERLEARIQAALEEPPVQPPPAQSEPIATTTRVSCPICAKPGMRREEDIDGYASIFCVNHQCGSNGGIDFSGMQPAAPQGVDLRGFDLARFILRAGGVIGDIKPIITVLVLAYFDQQPGSLKDGLIRRNATEALRAWNKLGMDAK